MECAAGNRVGVLTFVVGCTHDTRTRGNRYISCLLIPHAALPPPISNFHFRTPATEKQSNCVRMVGRVLEAMDRKTGGEEEGARWPQALLTGIVFDLPTSKCISKISVACVQHASQLSSARLGLPSKSNKCETCGSDKLHDCDGHFGYLKLPTPVYHPFYVTELIRIFNRICLGCFQLKQKTREGKKRKSRGLLKDILEGSCSVEFLDNHSMEATSFSGMKGFGGKFGCSKYEIGSDSRTSVTLARISVKEEPEDLGDRGRSTLHNGVPLKKHNNYKSSNSSKFSKGRSVHEPNSAVSGKQNTKQTDLKSWDVSFAENGLKTRSLNKKPCPYCQAPDETDAELYPEIIVNMTGKEEGIQRIELKISDKCTPPSDFWHFVEKYGYEFSDGYSRHLLPFEAIKILEQIPEKVLKKLGVNETVKQPGAFILDCLPIPPNCVRIPDMWGKTTIMTADNASVILKKIINVSEEIRESRSGKVSFMSHVAEVRELQSLVTQYLRIKGGPKVPGSKEPSVTFPGRVTKSDAKLSDMWLEKIRTMFLKKSCGLSSRGIITGDAYIGLNQIGIPIEIAKRVTIEECVNDYNKDGLQEIVNKGQCRTFVDKGGKYCSNEFTKSSKRIEIGEIINRGLQDGDIVLINRAPTIHKHSLLALRAYIHPGHTMIINPLICGPLGADFDGDCLHVFYPQSLESRAELLELLSVDQQLFSSHGGEANFSLTIDTYLASKLLYCTSLLNKTTMYQLSMWTSAILPKPALFKVHDGGPFWSASQLLQMALPPELNIDENDFSITDSEIMFLRSNIIQLQCSLPEIFDAIVKYKGPKAAVKCMNSVESCLIEWLSLDGFSTGLDDLVVIHDAARRNEFMNKMKNELVEISLLMKHMRGPYQNAIISQIQKSLQEVQQTITKAISSSNSFVLMVECGSGRSMNKVIQQVGFLGLQLFPGSQAFPSDWQERLSSHLPCKGSYTFDWNGKNYSSEIYGLIKSSFAEGLDPCETFIHSLSCREGLLGQKMGLKEPGILFKNLMAFLRDLTICYDGTVRNACGKFLVQFQYGSSRLADLPPGEPVGILAGTAIANPAYRMLSSVVQNGVSPLDILKETLMRRTYSQSPLRPNDRRIILHLRNCCTDETHSEKKAAKIQEHLKQVPLKDLATYVFIDHQKNWDECLIRAPFIGHIQLDKRLLEIANLSLDTLKQNLNARMGKKSHSLNRLFNKLILQTMSFCNVAQAYGEKDFGMPCLHFALRNAESVTVNRKDSSYSTDNILDIMINVIFPNLLETSTKGDDRIENVHISWNNESLASWVPRDMSIGKKEKGDIMIEVVVEANEVKKRGDAWKIAFDACSRFIGFLDLNRCVPYSIHEASKLLGISSAYFLTIQRLSVALEMVGKNVFREHFLLVADCITYTGSIIGFNPAGYRDFYHSLELPVPFTESTLKMPMKCFSKAAQRGVKDTLSDGVASCSWGKRASLGTGSNFDIIWHDLEEVEPLENQHKQMDAYEILEVVGMAPSAKVVPASLCLGSDFDELNTVCQEDSYSKKSTSILNSLKGSTLKNVEENGLGCLNFNFQENGGGNGWSENFSRNETETKNVEDLHANGWNHGSERSEKESAWNSGWEQISNNQKIKESETLQGEQVEKSGWNVITKDEHTATEHNTNTNQSGWSTEERTAKENNARSIQSGWEQFGSSGSELSSDRDQHKDVGNNAGPSLYGHGELKASGLHSSWNSEPNVSTENITHYNQSDSQQVKNNVWCASNTEQDANVKSNSSCVESGWGQMDAKKDSEQQAALQNKVYHTKNSWEQQEQNSESFKGRYVRRGHQRGYRGCDSASTFKPTGANTVPLGFKRSFQPVRDEIQVNAGLNNAAEFEQIGSSNLHTERNANNGKPDPEIVEKKLSWGSGESEVSAYQSKEAFHAGSNNDGWDLGILEANADGSLSQLSWGISKQNTEFSNSGQEWNNSLSEVALKTTDLDESQGWDSSDMGGRERNNRGRGGRHGLGRGRGGRHGLDWGRGGKDGDSGQGDNSTQQTEESFHDGGPNNDGWNSGILQSNADGSLSQASWESSERNIKVSDHGHVSNSSFFEAVVKTTEANEKQGWDDGTGERQGWDGGVCSTGERQGWDGGVCSTSERQGWDGGGCSMDERQGWGAGGGAGENKGWNDCSDVVGREGRGGRGRGGRRGSGRGRGGRGGGGQGRGTRQFTLSTKNPDLVVVQEEEIIQEIQPLMHSMRNILHFSSYKDGDRLETAHEQEVVDKVLCHHPEKEAKIGSGIDYIMIDNHSNFATSRCFFIVRNDGSKTDFSYKKCLKHLVQEKYPESAQGFTAKYFS